MDPDAIRQQLAEVADQLARLPEDAFEERFQLRQRQEGLRAQAREALATTGDLLSADEARSRLEQLKGQRQRFLDDTRLSHLAGAQTGQGGGIDPKYVHDMHRRMDEAFDLDGVNAAIARLERLIAKLAGE